MELSYPANECMTTFAGDSGIAEVGTNHLRCALIS
jgi:hypothetical protein